MRLGPLVVLGPDRKILLNLCAIWSETELTGRRPIGFDVSDSDGLTPQDDNALGSSGWGLILRILIVVFWVCFSGKRFSPPGGCDRGPRQHLRLSRQLNVREERCRRQQTGSAFVNSGHSQTGRRTGQVDPKRAFPVAPPTEGMHQKAATGATGAVRHNQTFIGECKSWRAEARHGRRLIGGAALCRV